MAPVALRLFLIPPVLAMGGLLGVISLRTAISQSIAGPSATRLWNGEYDLAVSELRAALRFDPWNPNLWRQLSVALSNIAAFRANGTAAAAASAAAHRSVELNPLDAENHWAFATALLRAGERTQALAEYRLAVDADPHNTNYLYSLGFLCENMGLTAKAEARYREALAVRPNPFIKAALARVTTSNRP